MAVRIALALGIGSLSARSPLAQEVGEFSAPRSSVGQKPAADWGEDFQIRVFGGEPTQRVLFLSFCREVQDDFRNVLLRRRPGKADRSLDWKIPIRIDLWGQSNEVYKGPDLKTSVEIGPDDRFLIRVSVKVHDRFREEAFRLELVKALLIEQMVAPFAERPSAFRKNSVVAPGWLAHGFDELLQHRKDGQPSAFYRGILESGQMLAPEKLIEIGDFESMEPVTRAGFRASSAAFVEALLNQPGGEAGVRAFLADLGADSGDSALPLLRQHFPAFREMDRGIEKWWALEIATMGIQQGFEYLTPEETEKWLTEALTVDIKPAVDNQKGGEVSSNPVLGIFQRLKKGKPETPSAPSEGRSFTGGIEQYNEFLKLPGAEVELEKAFRRLQRVKLTGFPLYRPVFVRYETVLQRLIAGKLKGIDDEIEVAANMRQKIRETLAKTRDHLNYFEATQAPQRSGAFDDYLKMRRILEEEAMPQREDRITQFMDRAEKEAH
ncbi:MAG: hypothetical protein P1U86_09540 [Verrucomicrobiales bacterium]|nr:hypothetical protein [Verrucomicrobiales bacterium]